MTAFPLVEDAVAVGRFPHRPGFGYAGSCASAQEVGGDFFDVLPMLNDSLLLVIADVMGKGLTAALFATSLRASIRSFAAEASRPSELLRKLNQLLYEELSSADVFITLQVAVADFWRRELRVANAGHCPLLICDGIHRTRTIAPRGMPLGIQPDAEFLEQRIQLSPGASILLYTDGVTEARDENGHCFGPHRLETWFGEALQDLSTASSLKESLLQELRVFQHGRPAADDQSFLILCDERAGAAFAEAVNDFALAGFVQ